jgi:signal transduction histidine kinase
MTVATHDEQTAPVSSTDNARRIEELGRIIMVYSDVTERLQQSHDQLLQTVQLLQQELSEKNRLLERKQRLAALGEMAAGLAHEIRNPLGGIQLYASLLARDVADRPASLATVSKISSGVRHLESLVGQVLQFTREIVAHPVQTNIADVVHSAVELAGAAAQAKNVTVQVDGGPESLMAMADPMLLGQAVLNLVLNAIDAVEIAGIVHVHYGRWQDDRESDGFQLVVLDNGPGIAPEILDRIFNPFFTTRETGTGLGLSIVHRIVEAHDGTVVAANQSGGGARFEIRI